jgi:hypothetical protein
MHGMTPFGPCRTGPWSARSAFPNGAPPRNRPTGTGAKTTIKRNRCRAPLVYAQDLFLDVTGPEAPGPPVERSGAGAPVTERSALSASTKRRHRPIRWYRPIEKAGRAAGWRGPEALIAGRMVQRLGYARLMRRPEEWEQPWPARACAGPASRVAGPLPVAAPREGGARHGCGERIVVALFYGCFYTSRGHKSPPWLPSPAGRGLADSLRGPIGSRSSRSGPPGGCATGIAR